jgi:hypothetical protein
LLNGCNFIENHAEYSSGGAISVIDEGTVILDGGNKFLRNKADVEGGAIFVRDATASVSVAKGVVFLNSSAPGSGVDVKAIGDKSLILKKGASISAFSPTVVWIRTTCMVGEFLQASRARRGVPALPLRHFQFSWDYWE